MGRLPPPSVKVTIEWSYNFNLPTCLHEADRDEFTFPYFLFECPYFERILIAMVNVLNYFVIR